MFDKYTINPIQDKNYFSVSLSIPSKVREEFGNFVKGSV